jgi:hypothetical protein
LLDLSKKLTSQNLVMRKLSGDGAVIDGPRIAGMQVTSKSKAKARNAPDRAWCQLVVANSTIEQAL